MRRPAFWALAAPLTAGTGVVVWAALRGTGNLDGDEAVFGLIARNAVSGSYAAFMYGQRYLGTLEALLGAIPMKMAGDSLLALRAGAVVLYAGFLVVHGILVRRVWGVGAAAVSLIVLAVPPLHLLALVARPAGAFSALLFFGTTALLLASWSPRSAGRDRLRLVALGVVIGAGLWSHPLMVVYIAALAASRLPGAPEWHRMHTRLERLASRMSLRTDWLIVLGLLAFGLVAVGALLANGCDAGSVLGLAHRVARPLFVATLAIALAAMAWTAWTGDRRRTIVAHGVPVGIGVLTGSSPAWGSWLATGSPPASALVPSCPNGIPHRLGLLVSELLPAVWSIDPGAGRARLAAAVIMIAVLALAFVSFVARHRMALRDAVLLRSRPPGDRPEVLWATLLLVPIVLAVLGANTVDVFSSRYLVVTWQATSVVVGVSLARLPRKTLVAVTVAVLAALAVVTLPRAAREWSEETGRFSPQAVRELQAFIVSRDVEGGYADYRNAYPLDFLIGDEVAISPHGGVVRYAPLARRAANLERVMVILDPGVAPEGAGDIVGLQTAIDPASPSGLGEAGAIDAILERRRVGTWDVWLIERRPERG